MIKPINQRSIDRLTSAQVITTINSGIKELLDNALDAGASVVDIRVVNQGQDGFSVQDNGHGIQEEDFAMVAVNHATSKIAEFSDLRRVRTLGFRGEALAALCVMGQVEITTNPGPSGLGFRLQFDHTGRVVETTRVPAPRGTLVEVTQLFATMRARRLRLEQSIDAQYKKLLGLVQEYAMFTSARLTVENQSRNQRHVALRAQGADLVQRIATVFRGSRTKRVAPVRFTADQLGGPWELVGVLSRPGPGLGDRGPPFQFLAVNGRPIQHKRIADVIRDVHRQANLGDSLLYVLDLRTDPGNYDVNVAPDKRLVLLHREADLLSGLRQALAAYFAPDEHAVPRAPQELPPAKRARQSLLSFASFAGSGSMIAQGRHASPAGRADDPGPDQIIKEELERQQEYAMPSGPPSGPQSEMASQAHREKEDEARSRMPTEVQSEPRSGTPSGTPMPATTPVPAASPAPLAAEKAAPSVIAPPVAGSAAIKSEIDESHPCAHSPPSPPPRPPSPTKGRPRSRLKAARHKTLNSHIHLPLTVASIAEAVASSRRAEESPRKQLLPWAVDEKGAEERLQLTVHKQDFDNMEIVGQFNLGFILVVNRKAHLDDLFVIDQHASDEIYNFEMLQQRTVLNRQPLVVPFPLELSAVDELIVQENLSVFENNGFSIAVRRDNPPGKQCLLTSVPYSKSTLFDESDVLELLTRLKSDPHQPQLRCSKLRAMFAMRACRSSIMIGRPLSMNRMREVVRHMGTLDKPWNCPHGRPTLRHITTLR